MNNQTCIDPPQLKSQAERRAYQSPTLSLLGDVCSLTEAGSISGNEQGNIFGMATCAHPWNGNKHYNKC